MYPSIGLENQRRISDPGHFVSSMKVVWTLTSSLGVLAENCESHLGKCWFHFHLVGREQESKA